MAAIGRLKDRARKYEQKEDWQSAIAAYQEVLQKEAESDDLEVELSLYNRIGDLHLRLGQTPEAVSYYETAADKYAESGFFNNAIALCNKALRHDPDRPEIYLKLSGLCAQQGFQTDARRWILEYSERQMKAGRAEEALTGLEDFADLSDDAGIRETLAQQLVAHDRQDEAMEQLRYAYLLRSRNGEDDAAEAVLEQARRIDPSADLEPETEIEASADEWGAPSATEAAEAEAAGEDVGEDVEETVTDAGLAGVETRRDEPVEPESTGSGLEGLETTAAGAADVEETETETGGLSGLEVSYSEQEPAAAPEEDQAVSLGGLETFDPGAADEDDVEPEPLPLLDTGHDEYADEALDTEEALDAEADEEPEPLPLLYTGFDDEPEEDLAGEPEAPEALGSTGEEEEDTIDLDAVLREMEPEEIAERAETGEGDSDPGFAAMLSQFKAKVTDPPAETDNAGDHYDLGLAFKEMGLLDEAIAEFQTALSGGTERLKVFEELGQCFIQMNKFKMALEVLTRALEVPHEDDSELLGVYYHLGQCHEGLGQRAQAREAYEKVLSLDDHFQDVPERMARL